MFAKNIFTADIDQLTRIMSLVGTPSDQLLEKLLSEEVKAECLIALATL